MVKKQHYVSQFYLRGFSEKNDDKVNIYRKKDKKIITTNVRSICYRKYFYDLEDDTIVKKVLEIIKEHYRETFNIEQMLKENPQYVETVFLNRLESDISKIINQILQSPNGLILQNLEVKIKLLMFFYNLHERSPFKRDKYGYLHAQRKKAYNKFSSPVKDLLVENHLSDPKELQIKNMIFPYNNIENYWKFATKYEWTLGIADHNNFFISSDNPASAFFMKEFCFPISTTKAILIRPKSHNKRKLYLDKKNKKYITKFNDKSVFTNNAFQDNESSILIGDRDSIKQYLFLAQTLKANR